MTNLEKYNKDIKEKDSCKCDRPRSPAFLEVGNCLKCHKRLSKHFIDWEKNYSSNFGSGYINYDLYSKYMKTLKDICHYSGTGYCPGCGITPEALQDLLTSPTIKAKAEEREKIINMFNGEIALGLRRRLQKPKS